MTRWQMMLMLKFKILLENDEPTPVPPVSSLEQQAQALAAPLTPADVVAVLQPPSAALRQSSAVTSSLPPPPSIRGAWTKPILAGF